MMLLSGSRRAGCPAGCAPRASGPSANAGPAITTHLDFQAQLAALALHQRRDLIHAELLRELVVDLHFAWRRRVVDGDLYAPNLGRRNETVGCGAASRATSAGQSRWFRRSPSNTRA